MMRAYNVFFVGTVFFLLGVFLSSIGWGIGILTIFILVLFFCTVYWFILRDRVIVSVCALSVFMLLGAIFYTNHNRIFTEKQNIPFNVKTNFEGVVEGNPKQKKLQEVKVKLNYPHSGSVLLRTAHYPEFSYGDSVEFEGVVSKVEGGYATYLKKEGIAGISLYPKTKIIENNSSSQIKKSLLTFKKRIEKAFQETLPYRESAFLGGILLGSREEFSDEFTDAMEKSGTTHLVALSGYNILIIINATLFICSYFTSRRTTLFITAFLILGFVFMTGAESSVVRAAIMGIIVALAPILGRVYAPRNSIALAGLMMTLHNPMVLAYDVGFQLSFLALLGIIYVRPALKILLKIGDDVGFLGWKENALMTISAQITVAPLLMMVFGSFTLTALVANILILEMIPITMFIGAILAVTHLASYALGLLVSWFVLPLLKFEIAIIFLFSKIAIPFSPKMGIITASIYYIIVALIVYRSNKI